MRLDAPVCDFGWIAPDFSLPGLDGAPRSYDDIAGPNGTLIAFVCNHCPYVKASIADFVADTERLKPAGIGIAAIMPNDYHAYPADAPDRMHEFAAAHGFDFPYLLDETQDVARAYGAVCTPEFFGFNAAKELQFHGRLDDARINREGEITRELLSAMLQIAETGQGPAEQVPSMGCSIKWRA
jgi:peroxiredoxin